MENIKRASHVIVLNVKLDLKKNNNNKSIDIHEQSASIVIKKENNNNNKYLFRNQNIDKRLPRIS